MAVGGRQTRKHRFADKADIDAFLDNHMPIKQKEKDSLGEVFTPISVIDEMLAQLPQSVWSNPNLCWLDPACGIGNFPLKIISGGVGYPGLFKGLSRRFPNPQKRMQHICTMITAYDINQNNINTMKKAFKTLYHTIPIIHASDFLASSNAKHYNIIVGNPPYNSGGTKREGEKRIHVRFVKHSLTLLEPNGYLLFVCPPNYRQAGSTMNELFRDHTGYFEYIHILSPDETHRLFHVQTRVDIFLWHSSSKKEPTHIISEYGMSSNIRLDLTKHIPNFGHTIFEKLRKQPKADIKAVRSAEASTAISCAKFSPRGKYPVVHLIVEQGRKTLHRKTPHSLQNVPKILLNGLGVPYVFYDKDGQYGASQVPVVILNPSPDLVKFMNSKLFQVIAWGLRLTGNNNLPYIFDDVPADFGKGIQWTQKEQEFIDSFEIPTYKNTDLKTDCKKSKTRKLKKH